MWHVGAGWGWWMVFGWVWMLALIGLVAWAVSSLVARRPEEDRRAARDQGALEVLELRYARGEINHDEFEETRRHLTRSAAGPAPG